MAIEQLIAPIARLWCRSFGVSDEKAIARLADMLLHKTQDELAGGVSLGRIQSHFDETAAQVYPRLVFFMCWAARPCLATENRLPFSVLPFSMPIITANGRSLS